MKDGELLSFLSSTPVETLNEGLEEILSGVLNPAMEYIFTGKADPIVLDELLKEGVVGVLLGASGQAANYVYNRQTGTVEQTKKPDNLLTEALLSTGQPAENPLTPQENNDSVINANGGVSNESLRGVSGRIDTGSRGMVSERADLSGERRPDGGTASELGGSPVSPQLRAEMNHKGITDLGLQSQTDGAFFASSIAQAKAVDTKNGAFVSAKTPQELAEILQNGGKVFLNENGSAGVVVTADGDIEAVFKNQQTGPKGTISDLMITAIASGGTKLDCYGADLANMYSMFGLVPVAQVDFNAEMAVAEGWDIEKNGTPQVYVMMHNGDSAEVVLQNRGQYHAYSQAELDALKRYGPDEYFKALDHRDKLLAERNKPVVNSGNPLATLSRGRQVNGAVNGLNGFSGYGRDGPVQLETPLLTEFLRQKEEAQRTEQLRQEYIAAMEERIRENRMAALREEYEARVLGHAVDAQMADKSPDSNDWSKTVPREVSASEKKDIIEYAKQRGINIVDLSEFDGDPNLLKAEIRTLSTLRGSYGITSKITVTVSGQMSDADFAETVNNTIRFNAKALRNRNITVENILNKNNFAATRIEDIAAHEFGHIVSRRTGNIGIEISRKAYYNLFKKEISIDDITSFLEDNISSYSTTYKPTASAVNANRFSTKFYSEIISEVLSKDNSNSSDFTKEFLRLLMERV